MILLALQNHNDFLKTSSDVEKIFQLIDTKWVGLLLDIGSFHTPDPYADVAKNAKYAISWQLKEKVFVNDTQVDTDYTKIIDIVRKSGYRGYLPLETLGEGDPVTKLEVLFKKVLTFKFTVTNQDISDLLILDLDKTGPNLFHFFTNGLSLRKLSYEEVFSSQITPQIPSPQNSWKTDWLSKLKSGDSRQFTVNYSINSLINPGDYNASFEFPGLTHGVTKDQLFQDNIRIWIGDIFVNKKIAVK